jgi:hypothetical protein
MSAETPDTMTLPAVGMADHLAADPFVQQLVAENARLRNRVEALTRRLDAAREAYHHMAQIMAQYAPMKGADG